MNEQVFCGPSGRYKEQVVLPFDESEDEASCSDEVDELPVVVTIQQRERESNHGDEVKDEDEHNSRRSTGSRFELDDDEKGG